MMSSLYSSGSSEKRGGGRRAATSRAGRYWQLFQETGNRRLYGCGPMALTFVGSIGHRKWLDGRIGCHIILRSHTRLPNEKEAVMEQGNITTWLSASTQAVFPIFAHFILWFGPVGTFVIQHAIWGATGLERLVRVVSFLCAPLILLAAKSLGISMPDFLFRSASLTNPVALGFCGFASPA